MQRRDRFSGQDWTVAATMFLVSVALRIPFRSQLVYHWDGAQLALAIREYNVALNQPHAPGYFLYVMLGRLVNLFVRDPHSSLVWLSVVFGSALAAVLYLLGAAMFGRRVGVAAGLFAMTSPQVWFHSCVALMYVVDAFLVCLTVLYCWRAMNRGGTWANAVVIGAFFSLVAGVRQQTAPTLVPLLLYTFWNFDQARIAKLVTAALVAMVACAAWLLPMVEMSGGFSSYLDAIRGIAIITAPQTLARGGLDALLQNVFLVSAFCWNGLLLGAVVLVAGLFHRTFRISPECKDRWDRENLRALCMLAVWVVPMVVFGTAVSFTEQPGHVLSYLPALMLLAAVAAGQLRNRQNFVVVATVVCAVNAFTFLAWPQRWDAVLLGVRRTAREIREHDEQLGQTIQTIRSQFDPATTVVCHAMAAHYLFGLRHFQLHLPEFDHYQMQLDPSAIRWSDKPMLCARGGRTVYVSGVDWSGKRVAVLVVPPGMQLNAFKPYFDLSRAEEVPRSASRLFVLPKQARQP
jgi:hypothetical protein